MGTYKEEYDALMAELIANGDTEESIHAAAKEARKKAWDLAEASGMLNITNANDPQGS